MDQIPAGWYSSGLGGQQRYWDGTDWTEAIAAESSMPPQPKVFSRRALSIAANVCVVVGSALLIGAVFVPWNQDSSSLASDGSQLAFNLPSMVLVVAAIGLCLFRPTRTAAGLIALMVGLWCAIGLITEIGGSGWHLGQTLSASSVVMLGLGGIGCLVAGGVALKVDLPAVAWAAGGAVLAGLWIAGEWIPWERWTYRGVRSGETQASEISHWDCCASFSSGSVAANIREAATMLTLLAASILVALVWRRTAAGVGLIALGLLYLSHSVSWIVGLADPAINRDLLLLLLRITTEQATALQVTGTRSGLAGGWLATIAASALVILGILRLLAAIAANSLVTITPSQEAAPGKTMIEEMSQQNSHASVSHAGAPPPGQF